MSAEGAVECVKSLLTREALLEHEVPLGTIVVVSSPKTMTSKKTKTKHPEKGFLEKRETTGQAARPMVVSPETTPFGLLDADDTFVQDEFTPIFTPEDLFEE
jgi:hypothetical protein